MATHAGAPAEVYPGVDGVTIIRNLRTVGEGVAVLTRSASGAVDQGDGPLLGQVAEARGLDEVRAALAQREAAQQVAAQGI